MSSRHEIDVYSLSCAEHDFADLRPYSACHRVFSFSPLPLLHSPWGRLNQIIRCADLTRLKRLNRLMAEEIDKECYDAVVVHHCQFEKSPSILRYLRKTPSVYYCQEPLRLLYEQMPFRPYDDNSSGRRHFLNQLDPFPTLYRSMLKASDRRSIRTAQQVLVNSEFMSQAVSRIYQVSAKVSYHGVDTNQFKPSSVEKRHIVLSVGSLTPLKGFDFLIRAMSQYPGPQPPTLVVASNFQNPPERAYLKQLARDLKVELALVGNVGDPELVQLYNQAKVVVYAPIREPFGLVPLEAMACATPVVAVDEGGIAETVVHGQTGFLVERDPVEFARALQQLVDESSVARQFGENGRSHVLNSWTWEQAVARFECCLRQAIEAKPVLERQMSKESLQEQPFQ